MNRIDQVFQKSKKPFIAYLTAGDGGLKYSEDAFLSLVSGGVDIIEIGVPFSDPIGDGPVIQRAMNRSKASLKEVLDLVRTIRLKTDVPIVLFSYYNPILQAGETFIQEAKKAGVDGILIVDLPIEESDAILQKMNEESLAPIFLIAPSTPLERVKRISDKGKGFLYYVSQKGTTGMQKEVASDFHDKLKVIKSVSHLPVVAGFGIANREMAEEFLQSADGFVVGSYFVKQMENKISPQELTQLAKQMDPRSL